MPRTTSGLRMAVTTAALVATGTAMTAALRRSTRPRPGTPGPSACCGGACSEPLEPADAAPAQCWTAAR